MSRDLYIGVDPGKTGAMAVLDKQGELFRLLDFDPENIVSFLRGCDCSLTAYVERVHSMPGQGVSSTFSFGENFGWWQGIFDALRVPVTFVTPQVWQKKFSLQKTPTVAKPSLFKARALYPTADLHLKKHHNRADALLIARLCWFEESTKEPKK